MHVVLKRTLLLVLLEVLEELFYVCTSTFLCSSYCIEIVSGSQTNDNVYIVTTLDHMEEVKKAEIIPQVY